MATPPTLVTGVDAAAWNTTASTRTVTLNVQTGDVVAIQGCGADTVVVLSTPTNSGTAQTWTLQQTFTTAGYCPMFFWTSVMSVGNAAMVITVNQTNGPGAGTYWGFRASQWRGSDGVGASAKANVAGGAPSVSLTTTQANSAVLTQNGDWAAVTGATTWRTVNGLAETETVNYSDGSNYGVHYGYRADVGAAAANTYGMTAPTGQTYAIVAVEIKGAAAGGSPAYLFENLQPSS